jgi:hypothetical protein
MFYTTSPHGLVPLITRLRTPGQSYSNFRNLKYILSYIIKRGAAERLAECGGLLPKNPGFPIYSELHHTLSSGSRKVTLHIEWRLAILKIN